MIARFLISTHDTIYKGSHYPMSYTSREREVFDIVMNMVEIEAIDITLAMDAIDITLAMDAIIIHLTSVDKLN